MTRRFRIGISYSRAIHDHVKAIATDLATLFSKTAILFDGFHEAEFARPNLAFTLPSLYKDECDLVVVILDQTYQDKEWAGLEWDAVMSLRKTKQFDRVMLLAVGRTKPSDLFDLDGTLDVSERSSNQIAALVLERLAINEGVDRAYYVSKMANCVSTAPAQILPSNADNTTADALRDELFYCRRDQNPRSRRKALSLIKQKVERLRTTNARFVELRIAVWRQVLAEARHYSEYVDALSGLQLAFETGLALSIPVRERWGVLRAVSEAAVDISQTAPGAIELNKIVFYLNSAIKHSSELLGLHPELDHAAERIAELLAGRSKCRRALATTLGRRTQPSKAIASRVKSLRHDALDDAIRAKGAAENEVTLQEYALSLFAVSSSPNSENACKGLVILEKLASDPRNYFAAYEYMRQLKLRHRYHDAIKVFTTAALSDSDRRRFDANLTLFVSAILGLYYDGSDPPTVNIAALDGITWLEQSISAGHHRALEVIDYSFLLAITGQDIEKFTAPIKEITNNGALEWPVIGELSFRASRGEETLREALLLGLEDALLWNRLGTLYLDFVGDSAQAVVFYDQAIRLDSRSPMYHLNKTRALVRMEGNFTAAKQSLTQARRLAKNMWGWFTINQKSFDELEQVIEAHMSNSASIDAVK